MVLVPCLWHVLWPQMGGYCCRWTRVVPGWFRVENWRVPELPRSSLARWGVESTLWRGWVHPLARWGMEATLYHGWVHPRVRYGVGFHAIA